MSKKRKYRALNVKKVDTERLHRQLGDKELMIVGFDIAKQKMAAVLMDERHKPILNIAFEHPTESHQMLELLEDLPVRVEAAMEPTGTYGDALRHMLWSREIPVYRVLPKKTNLMGEVYDGVPSSHDVKSSHIVAKLHLDGVSSLWLPESDEKREVNAALRELELFQSSYQRNINRLEAVLARHWPEVTGFLELTSATLPEVLLKFGGPENVAERPKQASQWMRKVGGHLLKPEKILAVIRSAQETVGVKPIQAEREYLQALSRELRNSHKELERAKRKVRKLSKDNIVAQKMAPVVGPVTSMVLLDEAGFPEDYPSVRSYQKSLGLNLKERSSGEYRGQLKITKRGSGKARRYLWLASWRIVREDPLFKAWFDKKVERDGGNTGKAIVGVMRKLAAGLWHAGRGQDFAPNKLFDVTRLQLK